MFYVNIFKVKEWTCPFFILVLFSQLLTPGMMCLRLAVLLVSFLICVLSDRTPCEHQCFPYRIKCHSDCRRDYLSNSFKEKFKACSEKCEWYFNDCDDECECRATNIRERAGCEKICQTHPYLDEWNRRQCMIECKFDFSENYSKC